MFAIIVLIIDSVVAAHFAKAYVKRNRGLMLDMPDWSLIPDMTVILFQFILSGGLLLVFYLQTENSTPFYLGVFAIFFISCLVYMIFRIKFVRKLIASKVFKKAASEGESSNHRGRDKEQDKLDRDKLEHGKRLDDAAAYVEYTLLYTIRYSLVYLLLKC